MCGEVDVSLSRMATMMVLLASAVAAQPVGAQTAPVPPDLRIEGGWVRTDPAGAGSFGGLASQIPPAVLTPEAAAMKTVRG